MFLDCLDGCMTPLIHDTGAANDGGGGRVVKGPQEDRSTEAQRQSLSRWPRAHGL